MTSGTAGFAEEKYCCAIGIAGERSRRFAPWSVRKYVTTALIWKAPSEPKAGNSPLRNVVLNDAANFSDLHIRCTLEFFDDVGARSLAAAVQAMVAGAGRRKLRPPRADNGLAFLREETAIATATRRQIRWPQDRQRQHQHRS